ncbi:hypothetical protein R1sor_006576 [Riccia sorocarpa]|uniref:Bifunctional lysine-specific demethylase and histidyl-hydroxylase n=1 Tax=Riccia sorocarpa TaxID=122646 RepID=A0ABD3HMV0_9MARC
MQAGKRARLSPPTCSPSVSKGTEADKDLGARGTTGSGSGVRENEREVQEVDIDLRMEGCDESNCDAAEAAQEGSADGDEHENSQIEEEDVDAERLSYLNGFVAEVIEDSRSPGGVEDGLGIARDPDPSAAEQFFQWLIHPLSVERFHQQFWEKKPFLIRRPCNRSLYEGWFEKEDIESLLERETLRYGLNVDVTKYKDGARANFSTEGAAKATQVWKKFAKGWSVRILHPQRWSNSLFLLLSAFERYWHCVAGCNAYLTPAKSQGFSPHYDDIEAFVLQTEGKKRWRCYKPRSLDDVLPKFSSPDFSQEEIGEPILDEILGPGDLLYMPRGTIHQAEATSDTHSLHITVSVGQRNTWSDYLELALPRALELAWEDHLLLRESLPRDFATYMGVAHSDKDDPRRAAFLERVILCMDRLVKSGPWDSAVDQMAVKFIQARLPLPHTPEAEVTKDGSLLATLNSTSKVRLVAPDVARFVVEEDSAVLYHMLNNSRVLHNESYDFETDSSIEFPLDYAPALEELITAYPTPVCVSNLSIDSKKAAMDLVSQLFVAGLLVVVS